MRIQIQIGKEQPQSYGIDKTELIIGSSKKADIMLPLPEISRQHLTLISEGDKYFIIDSGSTNGTWLNDQRLEPHTKHEFTMYFPYRLAQSVAITLVDEEATGTTHMNPASITSPPAQKQGRDQTKTELELDFKRPKGKPKAIPVKVETEVVVGSGTAKGLILMAILVGIGIFIYLMSK